jgi:hypothetical protein
VSDLNLLDLERHSKVADPTRYSVQSRAEDSTFAPMSDVNGGGVFWITMGAALDDMPAWNPVFPNFRDRALLQFSRTETMLASAVYSMKTRIGTLDFALNGPPRAKKFAQELLEKPGLGDSLREVIQKISGDLDTSDNGAFIELWRPGNPLSDAGDRPVLGFAHLDSRQCWRSFDPEFPVWYTNPVTNEVRKLHRTRVVMAADNPQSVELARGIGFCATSRALRMTRVFRNMQIFLDEKVSGRFTRAIGAVSGINANQLRNALKASEDAADSKGFVIYKDIPFLINPNTEPGNDVKIIMQDLASIPDGFVFRDDADLYAYILAFAFGVDAREFWPATQSGATKADASVQNMKAQGRGIGNRIQTMVAMLRACLPETVEFEFDYTDDAQDLLHAQINQVRVGYYDMNVKNGTITAQESRALQIAEGVLDETVLSTMEAPVTSDSNPDTPQENLQQPDANQQQPQDANQPGMNGQTVPAQGKAMTYKSFDDYRRSLRALTRGYWAGQLSAFDFVDGMASAINRHFEQAWQQGEAINGVQPGERSDAAQARLDLAINTEVSYITGFAQAIADNSKANGGALQPMLDRAELWANGYARIVILAQTVSGADLKMKWIRDPLKDSCVDCLQYDGKIFYRSQWEAAGVYPRGDMLACTGINCGCTWEPTTDRKTVGEVPTLIGHKHLTSEVHIHSNGVHHEEPEAIPA